MPDHPSSARDIAATIAELDDATDQERLRAGIHRFREALATESRAHPPTLTLAAEWSEAVRRSVAAAARIIGGDQALGWTWFVSGSVARGEAIPGSDVETLIVLDDDIDDAGKAVALARAADVHDLLEGAGLRLDANGVLASRPRFCRRQANWTDWIERWCAEPAEDRGVVMTGLLADAAGVSNRVADDSSGDADGGVVLDDALRMHTVAAARRHPEACRAMLQDATTVRAGIPSRLRIFATQDDRVDLKVAALEPIVKIARWAALYVGSEAVSTLERLDDGSAAGALDAEDASVLQDCFHSLARIRWRLRAGAERAADAHDVVALSELAPADRAALRAVAREVGGVRRKLAFLASTSSFR